eukprot:CAMPEP_0201588912 /NCGR_PEP_ID=MMETSP0190_2-20130828/160303_1 /ASSEMBLY_ACC=CAM_ASM_000263 /TAXON_ID=37353 /ORGANISM="Rosalina sp." /LENGTH=310 /DNA_ID=CAMNT_0048041951 /DNA_START=172 /DNA_END=1101 /DNA_ORIENTATION=-
MRLKLYQANTQPASLREAEEPDEDDPSPPPPHQSHANSNPMPSQQSHHNRRKQGSDISNIKNRSKNMKSYKRKDESHPHQPGHGGGAQSPQPGHGGAYAKHPQHQSMDMVNSHSYNPNMNNQNNDDRKPSFWKRGSIQNKRVTDAMGLQELAASPTSPRLKNAARSQPAGRGSNGSKAKESGLKAISEHNNIPSKPKIMQKAMSNPNPSQSKSSEPKLPASKSSNADLSNPNLNVEDEADAYIPFDEPDEFNLLDEEYKKSAMKFVSEKDAFNNYQSMDALNGDVNLMAQEVLAQELSVKEAKLPDLQGW